MAEHELATVHETPSAAEAKETEMAAGRDELDGDPSLTLAAAVTRSPLADLNGRAGNAPPASEEDAKIPFADDDDDAHQSHGSLAAGEDAEDVEYFCGVGPWHPAWLQRLRDARVFTFLLCLFSTVEGALVSGPLSYLCHSSAEAYFSLGYIQENTVKLGTTLRQKVSILVRCPHFRG